MNTQEYDLTNMYLCTLPCSGLSTRRVQILLQKQEGNLKHERKQKSNGKRNQNGYDGLVTLQIDSSESGWMISQ